MAKKSAAGQWQAFYAAAEQFRDAAPWTYMNDSMLFGVENPDTGEIGWCCVLGNAGEFFALAVYKGLKGLDSYFALLDLEDAVSAFNPENLNAVLSQDCWMISFQNAGNVSKEQKTHLKALGLSFRGPQQWIVVETMDPGLAPWLPEERDLPFLIHCLRESLALTERVAENPDLLLVDEYLVREPVRQGNELLWSDKWVNMEDLEDSEESPLLQPSKEFLEKVKIMPVLRGAIVIANFFSPAPVQERKDWRPWRPMLMLGIAPGSGFILSQDLAPLPEVPKLLERFLLNTFKAVGGKPSQIGVHSLMMADWLAEICEQADIELVHLSGDEDYFTDALESLSGIMG